MSALKPIFEIVAFDSEGAEQGPFHSRVLDAPNPISGLTLGRGYDMKMKSAFKIQQDLIKSGIKLSDAKLLAQTSGLYDSSAKSLIASNKLEKYEITQQQQVNLFNISYKKESETKRLFLV